MALHSMSELSRRSSPFKLERHPYFVWMSMPDHTSSQPVTGRHILGDERTRLYVLAIDHSVLRDSSLADYFLDRLLGFCIDRYSSYAVDHRNLDGSVAHQDIPVSTRLFHFTD